MLKKAYSTRHQGAQGLLFQFLLSFCLLLSAQWMQAQCSASISGELAICPGGSRVLTASSASTYTWSTGATSAAITVNTAGTYTVTTTDATGCTATASATAYILSAGTVTAPAPLFFGSTYRICYGTTLQMSSTVPGGTWKSINNSYQVLTINATTGLVTPTTGSIFTDTNTIAYVVSAPGCNVGAIKTIEVRGLIPGTMNGNTNICSSPYYGNNTTALSITGGAGGGTWASSNTGAATVNTSGLVTAVNPGSSTISYTVTAEGCANSTAQVVTVNANPSALVTSTPNNGCVNQAINISVPDAGPGATYSWSGDIVNQNSNVINSVSAVAGIKIYQVTVTSAAGCSQSGFGSHLLHELPVATITANPNPVCLGLMLDLSVPAAASTTYAWSGPGINSSTGSSITATPPAAGLNTYTVTAMTNAYYGSCSNTGTVNVTVNNIYPCPTGLSPFNGQTGVSPNIGFLSWDNDNNVAFYRVTFGNNAPNYNNILNNVSITGNNAAIGVLGANQTYGFKVVPVTYGCDPTDCPISTFSTCLPTFNCPANQNILLNGGCSMVIPDLVTGLMANPGCTALTFTQNPTAGTVVASTHNGTVPVVITPSNPLVASCTVMLTGKDMTAPTITCPANTTVNANASCQNTIGSYNAAAISDNCNPSPAVTQSPAASTLLTGHNAAQTVTLTANDGNGNTATCSFSVTLKDITPPNVICPGNQFVNVGANCIGLMPNYAGSLSFSDNCSSTSNTQTPIVGTPLAIGTTTTLTLTASDLAGNTASCSFSIVTRDVMPPSITCPANTTVNANASCQNTIGTYNAASVSDNCNQSPTVTQSPAASTVLTGHNAAQTVTLTANDGNGNTATCSFSVTLKDVTAPSITCPANTTMNANASCQNTVGSYSAASVSDNCNPSPAVTQSPASSTVLSGHNAAQTVTLTANDGNGNTATCSFSVTLKDVTAPSITCPANTTVNANASCQNTVGSYNAASVSDNCNPSPAVTQSPATSTILTGHNAAQTVTLTANDGNGNTANCSFTVTLKDVTAPSISCPANTTVNANASCQNTIGAYNAASISDNCNPSPAVTQNPASSTLLTGHNAAQTVTLTANDGNGNTANCSFTVTLKDVTAPSITCPANTTVNANASCQNTVGAYNAASVSDNCNPSPAVTQSPAASTVLTGHNAAQTVTLTANDGNGNTANCSFTVTLKDVTAPTVICKNATANLNTAGSASITIAQVFQSGTDNCGTVNQVSVLPNTFTCSNLGANTVTLTVNDGHGNTGTCTATVTVVDLIAPTTLCKNVTVALNASGQASITPAQMNNGSFDNCTLTTLVLNRTNFGCADIGQNLVTLTGTDQSGNNSSCTAVITVQDLLIPVAKCKNTTLNLGSNGSVTIPPGTINNNSTDNCTMNFAAIPASLTCSNIGNNTVTLRVTDAANNQSTCTAIVTVKDATGPVALCKNPTIFLNEVGMATLSVAQVNNGSTDNCGISTISLSKTQFNCSELAGSAWPVFLTMKDASNNTSTCISYVTVKDNIAPTAICENTTVTLGSNGKVVVSPDDLAFNSFDNCSVWSYSPAAKVYTAANIGNNNLTITVKDWSNNAATCVSVVTVLPYNNNNIQGTTVQEREQETTPATIPMYLAPNPTFGRTNLVFELTEAQEYQVHIWDLAGRLCYTQSAQGAPGENQVTIDLQDLAAGLYVVDFTCAGQQVFKKLTKVRE